MVQKHLQRLWQKRRLKYWTADETQSLLTVLFYGGLLAIAVMIIL